MYLSNRKLQQCIRWSLAMDKLLHKKYYDMCNNLSMQGLKLIHIYKMGA